MDYIANIFLTAYKAALQNQTVSFQDELTAEDWITLFQLADKHHVLPMIYEAVYQDVVTNDAEIDSLFAGVKNNVIQSVMIQTLQTNAFSQLYKYLDEKDIHPIVVKGIICRSLYEKPDYRMSGDEDLLVDEDVYMQCHEKLLDYGMVTADPKSDIHKDFEIPYGMKGSPLYIEVHKSLFPPDSDAYGNLNDYFKNAKEKAVNVDIDGVSYRTLCPSDHLFYLICHAFKHFLHSGFGIRQVSDIVFFANTYGSEINWQEMLVKCREIQADRFAAALFSIGYKYLLFDPEKACYPSEWSDIDIDDTYLLDDLLDAGVYGDASMSRKHSSTMTLSAVAAEKQGKKTSNGIMKSLFPSASALESRYPYLKDKKYLLPAAWIDRIYHYHKETSSGKDNSASESIRIGEERVDLFRYYGILKDKEK